VTPWPTANRSVFYIARPYKTTLPIGDYDLVVGKGLEYRLASVRFAVQENKTKDLKIPMRRWRNMAEEKWFSGEDHIHYALRSADDDHDLESFTQAEDLKVANILQFGNVVSTYLLQRQWRPILSTLDDHFVLVPGQEDPRTTRLGHTIQLNIRQPIRNPAHYPLYNEVFNETHRQGGLAAYAHVLGSGWLGSGEITPTGLAIDVPLGLVDFAEVMSLDSTSTLPWFDFLNLGYKIAPTAGTDFPWGGVPGTSRSYVKIDDAFSPQAWFDGVKHGKTFVTNGPVLAFTINGQGMGSDLHLEAGAPLIIEASASMNPDYGDLTSLELIEQGDVVRKNSRARSDKSEIALDYRKITKNSTWYVLRARGSRPNVVALSAPIYVEADGQSFWERAEVPQIVARLKTAMSEMLSVEGDEIMNEPWEIRAALRRVWQDNRSALEERVEQVNAIYDALVECARSAQ
jgi:hypothetical protein